MICPNCKTDLVEVNGRYICSECGREIPENEVMASDWGNGATARAGLYGAGVDDTPAEGSAPVTDYTSSLSEIENEDLSQPVSTPPAVESEMPEAPVVVPEAEPIVSEPAMVSPTDTGLYTPAAEQPAVETPVLPQSDNVEIPVVEPEVVETPVIPVATPEVQEIPINTPVVAPVEPAAPPQPIDPVIYTDPMYEAPLPDKVEPPVAAQQTVSAPVPTGSRTNMIILIVGMILVLLLIGGGVWAYLALNGADDSVTTEPATVELTWQELQVVDGGFKIQFPGAPEKVEETQAIGGVESALTSYTFTEGDASYTAAFSVLDPNAATAILASPETSLPQLVKELADTTSLTVSDTKIGKYYSVDAVDFTLSNDTASYRGKIMVRDKTFIMVKAGSESGQAVDFDKFIKSFSFLETAATGGAAE